MKTQLNKLKQNLELLLKWNKDNNGSFVERSMLETEINRIEMLLGELNG